MHYDPIKRTLGDVFNRTPWLRQLFYNLLDLLLLRTWHVHRELRQWAKGRRDQAQNILDAGAGYGQYTYWLSGMSDKWQVLAVDVKDEQVADSNRFFRQIGRPHVQFAVQDLVLYQQPNSFDLALAIDVMEHILEDVEVMTNLHASLKDGGMLIISTPSDQGGSDVHGADDASFIEEHVRDGYNINEIQQKLRTAGFERIEAKYSYGLPGQISWRLSMKYPILMLGVSKAFFVLLPFYYLVTFPFCLVLNWLDARGHHDSGTGLIVKAWK
ncbi:class I SAM-dependent methyltransferase [Hymenobacter busanensis]|uniref:Class I SAM-dependent methyltransferase n=1 Tax=Hymenobacter busanensis TaxID=2607656 RepID=A0A7L5A362_9BACT|nr:class I SAM-dependent methyltransferase [Hymenobacter busanensis]KAA9333055.1 class I SAM-dependent methyltransferase [Hymenobacter busanensis]QHJ08270.1 methyltransferase domain-containing protein [Hymenobacter busanensis]